MMPFTRAYVLKVTFENVQKAIDRSTRKTAARLDDDTLDYEKRKEVLEALVSLSRLSSLWNRVYQENSTLIDGDTK